MQPVRQNRRWVWFFVVLAILGACAVLINLVYNVLQQLRPEQLTAARALWDEKAPADYNLEYQVKEEETTGGTEPLRLEVERISLKVRGKKVESVTRNSRAVPDQEWSRYGVAALFELIERNLDNDGKPGEPRTYAHALFDKKDGHPIHYVRRIMGTRRRLEIRTELTDPADPNPKPSMLQ